MNHLYDGKGYILNDQVTVTESGHYDIFSSIYLLDPNPSTNWDSGSNTPRFVEFMFKKAVSVSVYSIKMSVLSYYITAWDIIGTLGSDEFCMHTMPYNNIFHNPSQYESFNLNKSYKVQKVKIVINSVTNNNAAYISNIDFLVDEDIKRSQYVHSIPLTHYKIFTLIFIVICNNRI